MPKVIATAVPEFLGMPNSSIDYISLHQHTIFFGVGFKFDVGDGFDQAQAGSQNQ